MDTRTHARTHARTQALRHALNTSFFLHVSIATLQGGSGVSAPVYAGVRLVKDIIYIYIYMYCLVEDLHGPEHVHAAVGRRKLLVVHHRRRRLQSKIYSAL